MEGRSQELLVYNNLAAGNHTVAVTDANGCIFTAPDATIATSGGATAVAVTTTPATCGNITEHSLSER